MNRKAALMALCVLLAVGCVAAESRRALLSYPGKGKAGCKDRPAKGTTLRGVQGSITSCDDWDDEEMECEFKDSKGKKYEITCKYDDDKNGKAECKVDPDGPNNSFPFECPASYKEGPIKCSLNWKSHPGAAQAVTDLLSRWCPNDD